MTPEDSTMSTEELRARVRAEIASGGGKPWPNGLGLDRGAWTFVAAPGGWHATRHQARGRMRRQGHGATVALAKEDALFEGWLR